MLIDVVLTSIFLYMKIVVAILQKKQSHLYLSSLVIHFTYAIGKERGIDNWISNEHHSHNT